MKKATKASVLKGKVANFVEGFSYRFDGEFYDSGLKDRDNNVIQCLGVVEITPDGKELPAIPYFPGCVANSVTPLDTTSTPWKALTRVQKYTGDAVPSLLTLFRENVGLTMDIVAQNFKGITFKCSKVDIINQTIKTWDETGKQITDDANRLTNSFSVFTLTDFKKN